MKTHDFPIFERVIPLIASGQKDLEVRTSQKFFSEVVAGDLIIFSRIVKCEVICVRKYKNFDSMLQVEVPARIMPGWTKEQVLSGLRRIYSKCYEDLGVVVFEIKTVTK